MAGAVALAPFSVMIAALGQSKSPALKPAPVQPFSPEDDRLLDEMERLSCCYFWEQASPETGLVKDRCNARRATTDNSTVASIAATGFGLTDRKSTRLNSSHSQISYAVFCL